MAGLSYSELVAAWENSGAENQFLLAKDQPADAVWALPTSKDNVIGYVELQRASGKSEYDLNYSNSPYGKGGEWHSVKVTFGSIGSTPTATMSYRYVDNTNATIKSTPRANTVLKNVKYGEISDVYGYKFYAYDSYYLIPRKLLEKEEQDIVISGCDENGSMIDGTDAWECHIKTELTKTDPYGLNLENEYKITIQWKYSYGSIGDGTAKDNISKNRSFEKTYKCGNNKNFSIAYYGWAKSNEKDDIWIYIHETLKDSTTSETHIVEGWLSVARDGVFNDYISFFGQLSDNFTNDEPIEKAAEEENRVQLNPDDSQYVDSEYDDSLYASDASYQLKYWEELYNAENVEYAFKSHNSIIGLPLQFMGNVDMRIGNSMYGKQFMEDIIYDMNIACIKPGGPVLNPVFEGDNYSEGLISNIVAKAGKIKAYWDNFKTFGASQTLKDWIFTLVKGGQSRFYNFMSDYTHYTHYVNTLCHLFITFLGIADKIYYPANGNTPRKYALYTDDLTEIESDKGLSIRSQFGFDNAVYLYYSPESSINRTFSNSTKESQVNATLQSVSEGVKEWNFFMNSAGIESGKGIADIGAEVLNYANSNSSSFLGRLLGNATEGVTTICAGNNLSLPEIYSDSDTTVEHTFTVKLVSPYGDPESVFLHVLRPLARILAFSLPRQYGPNSYTSPFIVQAFSKGQFNCQLGIVTNLSITRCGNGGESHTIHHIPTELEVSITIADMYEKVFLSNEYFGAKNWKTVVSGIIDKVSGTDIASMLMTSGMTFRAARLIFNNVGLIDFVASFCGANLNMPTYMDGWTFLRNMMKNRQTEFVDYNENDGWVFPYWEKKIQDAHNDAITNLKTPIVTI